MMLRSLVMLFAAGAALLAQMPQESLPVVGQ